MPTRRCRSTCARQGCCSPNTRRCLDIRLSATGWAIDPSALRSALIGLWDEFGLPIMITENGVADDHDELRPEYLRTHLIAVADAIDAGRRRARLSVLDGVGQLRVGRGLHANDSACSPSIARHLNESRSRVRRSMRRSAATRSIPDAETDYPIGSVTTSAASP